MIDFHAHIITEEYISSLKTLGIDPIDVDGFALPKWDEKEHLEFMKEAGIEHTVLSSCTPHLINDDKKMTASIHRKVNISISKICQKYKDKFSFVASIPLPYIDEAIEEYYYSKEKLNAIGVKLTSNTNGIYLGDPSLDKFMEELNKNHALVIIHPQRAYEYPKNPLPSKVAAIFEYPTDTTRAILNMMAHKIMTRFPNIKFIIPHTGSFLPYMLQRFIGISKILESLNMMENVDLKKEFENLYFDIAGDPEPVALDMLLKVTTENKILYGSDYPHSLKNIIIKKKKHLEENQKYKNLLLKIKENEQIVLK